MNVNRSGKLLHTIATMLCNQEKVEILIGDINITSCREISIPLRWGKRTLSDFPFPDSKLESKNEKNGFFRVVLGEGEEVQKRLAPEAAAWVMVFETTTSILFITTHSKLEDCAKFRVYKRNILVAAEPVEKWHNDISIDFVTVFEDVFDIKWPDTLTNVRILADTFLTNGVFIPMMGCRLARRFFAPASFWCPTIRAADTATSFDLEMHNSVMKDLPLEFVGFVDVDRLIQLTIFDHDMRERTRYILDRVWPIMGFDETDPSFESFNVRVLPITSRVFAEAVALFKNSVHNVSIAEHGLIFFEGSQRTVAFPFDITDVEMTRTIVSFERQDDGPKKEIHFDKHTVYFGPIESHACETASPFFVYWDAEGNAQLSLDTTDTKVQQVGRAINFDEFNASDVTVDPTSSERSLLQVLFPLLHARIMTDIEGGGMNAILREVHGRKLIPSFSITDIDIGGNMNSLGMSIMMYTLFRCWFGAKVRLFMTRARSALLGYWSSASMSFRLVHPFASTNFMQITLGPIGNGVPAIGTFIEIFNGRTWRVSIVIDIWTIPSRMVAHVRMLYNNNCKQISLSSKHWRHFTDANSDLHKQLSLVTEKRARRTKR